jgi:hypothetical protein
VLAKVGAGLTGRRKLGSQIKPAALISPAISAWVLQTSRGSAAHPQEGSGTPKRQRADDDVAYLRLGVVADLDQRFPALVRRLSVRSMISRQSCIICRRVATFTYPMRQRTTSRVRLAALAPVHAVSKISVHN